MKIHGSQSIVSELNDNGNYTYIVKPRSLRDWVQTLETSNNSHDNDIDVLKSSVSMLDARIKELKDVVTANTQLISFIKENYPSIIAEFVTVERAKARILTPPDDQPVTMGP